MNIGRKELGNEWLKALLEVDGGIIMDMPVTIRKIHQKMDSRRLLELGVRSQETSHVSVQVVHESSRGERYEQRKTLRDHASFG